MGIKYVNPIPMIDAGKKFILELNVELDEITELEHAKLLVAEYLLSLPKERLAKALKCKKTYAVYPDDIEH